MKRALTLALASAALATAIPAGAASAAPTAAAACEKGFVCVYPVTGTSPILIPEGQKREFKGGIKATIANGTSLSYCVSGELHYSLAPGAEVDIVRTITATAPNPGACLN